MGDSSPYSSFQINILLYFVLQLKPDVTVGVVSCDFCRWLRLADGVCNGLASVRLSVP